MATEPTLEELSAYVDGELDGPEHAELESHLKTCSSCRSRLEGLRQAVSAIRALPMETPPRNFTVPAQRRQSWHWAPIGWATSAAAAILVVAFGITQLHGFGGAGTTATSLGVNRGAAEAPAGGSSPAAAALDQRASASNGNAFPNYKAVAGPNTSRKLTLEVDAFSYSSHGTMRISISLQGAPSESIVASEQGLSVILLRSGAGVELGTPVGISSYNGTPFFARTYDLASLPLGQSRAGKYELVATWQIPDGSGQVLQASIPITLTGN